MHYALCKAAGYICITFASGALYSIFFFLPRAGSGETGTRQMLSDSTRGSRGWFFGVCAVKYALHREQGGGQVVAKRVLQLPPRGQWVFVVMSELICIYTAQHPVYVCIRVQRTLLFPAGKTRGGQHAINRGREEN